MTWQAISERSSQTPGMWPHSDLIDSFREKVEAGTYWMAHRHVGDKVQLVVKKRRVPGRPCRYWTAAAGFDKPERPERTRPEKQPRRDTKADALAILKRKAEAGERCPTNPELADMLGLEGVTTGIIPELARAGELRIEVYTRNWRVIEIDGMRTMECPHDTRRPYKVIDCREKVG